MLKASGIYLDYNATTPVDQRVLEVMLPYFSDFFGNAASATHPYGWKAADAVKASRQEIASIFGCTDREIIFTSGATESNNLALKGVAESYADKGDHLLVASTEHKAVLDACKSLEQEGKKISYLPVGEDGILNLDALENAISPKSIMVCVMLANNETGVIQPIKEISEIAHRHGLIMMTDAVQGVGKIPINVDALGIDLMSFNAHKVYGPKGIGGLFVRRKSPRVKLEAQIHGGGHERNLRSGTLNVPGIVGMAKAISLGVAEMQEEGRNLKPLRDRLENALLSIEGVYPNGSLSKRLPHVSNLSFKYLEGQSLVKALFKLAVATGSACSSADPSPSHVLKAMGLPDERALSSIRFSLGRFTTPEEIEVAIAHTNKVVDQLRKANPVWQMTQNQ